MKTNSGYQRLERHDENQGSVRELVLGLALLAAVVLACLLAPALPGELDRVHVDRSARAETLPELPGASGF